MEIKNREEIIKIESDVSHIKHTTDKIEATVAELLKAISNQSNDIIETRGRVRELEHEVKDLKASVKENKTLSWKLFGFLVAGGTGAVSILEVFFK